MTASVPPIAERLRAVADATECGAGPNCVCQPCRLANSIRVILKGVAEHSHPFPRLCWLLDNILQHPDFYGSQHTQMLPRVIAPILTRDEWVDALAWNPSPWGGGHLLRSHLLMHLDLMGSGPLTAAPLHRTAGSDSTV